MSSQEVEVLVVGGGQAGLAMSEHLGDRGVPHLVLERHRIAERWRSERWDSLVANGPAWHDRFPGLEFVDLDPDAFASKEQVADYFVAYAEKIGAPIRCGVEVTSVTKERRPARLSRGDDGRGPSMPASSSPRRDRSSGPSSRRSFPMARCRCRSTPAATATRSNCPSGAVLVVGAGSSGVQIADELRQSGRRVYLSVGRTTGPRAAIAVVTSAGGSVCSACGTPKPLPWVQSTSRSRSAERTAATPSTSATSPLVASSWWA